MANPKVLTKDDAEVLKFLAEADKYQAEAEAAREQAKINAAEARRTLAVAAKEEHYAENARISTAATKRQEQVTLAGNHYHHEFSFNAGVHEDSVDACATQMAYWHRMDPTCPMTIKINSPGGSVIDGMDLFDEISSYSLRTWDTREDVPKGTHHTTMIVRGWAASMAGILLQAADHRVIGPEAFLMIHEVSSLAGGKIQEIKDEVLFLEKLSERVSDIFVRRSDGKMTKPRFKKLWDRKDIYLTSQEALTYGFVDEIG